MREHHTGSSLLDELATTRDEIKARMLALERPEVPKATQEPARQNLQAEHSASLSRNVILPFAATSPAGKEEAAPLVGSPLNPRLIFANFLVGGSNQLAHSEAMRVAELLLIGASPRYNPLYLHASVGLGKTHLLQAVAHAATLAKRRVIYLTSENFLYDFLPSLKISEPVGLDAWERAFEKRLRKVDVLLIDDIQFLHPKPVQTKFLRVLDAFLNGGRQIVIAADRTPGDLESLEERVRSRLSGGLCIEIGGLDEALRVKIIEARIAAAKIFHQTFEVPAEVVAYVASVIRTNGRDLDGAVNRLLAHASLSFDKNSGGEPLSLETAELAIRDLVRTPDQKKVKIEDIQKLVASHFNVSRADIQSARRTASVVRPRQIAMYLSKLLTPRSLPEIGRRFGGRDHTTVLHAVRKIDDLINGTSTSKWIARGGSPDKGLAGEILVLKEMLLE